MSPESLELLLAQLAITVVGCSFPLLAFLAVRGFIDADK